MAPFRYDVFLSFRGEDTRRNFTGHLFNALRQAGIETYMDHKLEKGDSIGPALMNAIQESRISIPIFSINYASSTWCLDEIAKIMECNKNNSIGQTTVLPVFFGVDPSQVRRQTGNFAEAFLRHEERFEMKMVERWREALREAGNLSGWDLRNVENGDESKLIMLVVKRVIMILSDTTLDVDKTLVGIDSRVEDIMRLLNVESNDVLFVGIYGMGGIGKTTIAKVVFNQIRGSFDGSSFLADVREASRQHNGLVHLQNQFFLDILQQEFHGINSVDRGKVVIKERLRTKKVLIILDDVDENTQLKALVGQPDWFGPKSRIIITTRDKHVLNVHKVDRIYEAEEMNLSQSLQLFSMHAFGRDQPQEDYKELSNKVVCAAGGLPLTLEILGSFLFDKKEKEQWESELEKLKKIPHSKIMEKLKLSYNGLDENEKAIFLDIACFFIGMDKEDALHIWEGCDFFPRIGIEVLIHKSLVKIGDNNKLGMHDQLRDMGREIVRQESPKAPRMRSRLWYHEEVLNVLKNYNGTENVEGLLLDFGSQDKMDFWKKDSLSVEAFSAMPNLRLLRVDNAHFLENTDHFPSELRWLHWQGCDLEFIPSNFHQEKLAVLDFSRSNITEDWRGWHQNKFEKLKVLKLSHCNYLTATPDFASYTSLEKLILKGCETLVEVHESIGHLKRLVFLSLKDCEELENLPSSICKLNSLENLVLSGCSKLNKLPENLGAMASLKELLVDSTSIEQLPNSIGFLKNLIRLSLCECESLTALPNSLGELESLRELLLDATRVGEIPVSIGYLKKLETLSAKWCRSLTALPNSIGKLESLAYLLLDGTPILELPKPVGLLLKLRNLSLNGESLKEFYDVLQNSESDMNRFYREMLQKEKKHGPLHKFFGEPLPPQCFPIDMDRSFLIEMRNVRNLTSLCIDAAKITELPDDLGFLKKLEILNVSKCKKLVKLPNSLGKLESLIELRLDETLIRELPASIGSLKKLEILTAKRCSLLTMVPNSIGDLESLSELKLDGTRILELPNSAGSLLKLKCLSLSGCQLLENIPGSIGRIESLVELILDETKIIEIFDFHGPRNKLEKLEIRQCQLFFRLPDSIGNLTNLTTLRIDSAILTELPDVVGLLEKLEILSVSKCKKLVKLPESMGKMRLLQKFNMEETSVVELPKDFGMLSSLEKLEMANCRELESLPENFGCLKKLKDLHMQYNSKLTVLPVSFPGLCFLKELVISHCNLSEVPRDIGKLSSLEILELGYNNFCSIPESISYLPLCELSLRNCTKLQSLPQLPSSLIKLDAANCISMVTLPDLSNLLSLKELHLTNCEKLAEIQGLESLESLTSLYMNGCTTLANTWNKLANTWNEIAEQDLKVKVYHGTVIQEWFTIPDADGVYGLLLGIGFALENEEEEEEEEEDDDDDDDDDDEVGMSMMEQNDALLKITLSIEAGIVRNLCVEDGVPMSGKGIRCTSDLIMKNVRKSCRHQSNIVQLQGLHWLGFPLKGGDVIKVFEISPPPQIQGFQLKKFDIFVFSRICNSTGLESEENG